MTARRLRGFSLVELLVVMAVIAVLLALLAPSLRSVRESARRTVCLSNLRQYGLLMRAYMDTSSGGVLPAVSSREDEAIPEDQRPGSLARAVQAEQVARCPGDPVNFERMGWSYWYIPGVTMSLAGAPRTPIAWPVAVRITRLYELTPPGDAVVLTDFHYRLGDADERYSYHPLPADVQFGNALFFDGSADWWRDAPAP